MVGSDRNIVATALMMAAAVSSVVALPALTAVHPSKVYIELETCVPSYLACQAHRARLM